VVVVVEVGEIQGGGVISRVKYKVPSLYRSDGVHM